MVMKNYKKAIDYWELAVGCGNVNSMFGLATHYEKYEKYEQATHYYKLAIEKGNCVGSMYKIA